jgi:hypothetical protein
VLPDLGKLPWLPMHLGVCQVSFVLLRKVFPVVLLTEEMSGGESESLRIRAPDPFLRFVFEIYGNSINVSTNDGAQTDTCKALPCRVWK